jgi:hypothetical protein
MSNGSVRPYTIPIGTTVKMVDPVTGRDTGPPKNNMIVKLGSANDPDKPGIYGYDSDNFRTLEPATNQIRWGMGASINPPGFQEGDYREWQQGADTEAERKEAAGQQTGASGLVPGSVETWYESLSESDQTNLRRLKHWMNIENDTEIQRDKFNKRGELVDVEMQNSNPISADQALAKWANVWTLEPTATGTAGVKPQGAQSIEEFNRHNLTRSGADMAYATAWLTNKKVKLPTGTRINAGDINPVYQGQTWISDGKGGYEIEETQKGQWGAPGEIIEGSMIGADFAGATYQVQRDGTLRRMEVPEDELKPGDWAEPPQALKDEAEKTGKEPVFDTKSGLWFLGEIPGQPPMAWRDRVEQLLEQASAEKDEEKSNEILQQAQEKWNFWNGMKPAEKVELSLRLASSPGDYVTYWALSRDPNAARASFEPGQRRIPFPDQLIDTIARQLGLSTSMSEEATRKSIETGMTGMSVEDPPSAKKPDATTDITTDITDTDDDAFRDDVPLVELTPQQQAEKDATEARLKDQELQDAIGILRFGSEAELTDYQKQLLAEANYIVEKDKDEIKDEDKIIETDEERDERLAQEAADKAAADKIVADQAAADKAEADKAEADAARAKALAKITSRLPDPTGYIDPLAQPVPPTILPALTPTGGVPEPWSQNLNLPMTRQPVVTAVTTPDSPLQKASRQDLVQHYTGLPLITRGQEASGTAATRAAASLPTLSPDEAMQIDSLTEKGADEWQLNRNTTVPNSYAGGGIAGLNGPELAVVGEYGPEMITPLRPGQPVGYHYLGHVDSPEYDPGMPYTPPPTPPKPEHVGAGVPIQPSVPFQSTPPSVGNVQSQMWQRRYPTLRGEARQRAIMSQPGFGNLTGIKQPRALPSLGAPRYPSAQAWRRMRPTERSAFQRQVEQTGIEWPDYMEELKQILPSFGQRGRPRMRAKTVRVS